MPSPSLSELKTGAEGDHLEQSTTDIVAEPNLVKERDPDQLEAGRAYEVDEFHEDTEANKKLRLRYDVRILPIGAFTYLLCYLDRSNIGNAKIMNTEDKNNLLQTLKMTETEYSVALMIFLVAYTIFEIPSNYFLKKMSPSRWIAFLMFCWGSVTMGMGGVQNYAGITVTRLLLGIFEAGLFPGLVYYLTFWYRANERSLRVAVILASATLAGAFGGAIAYAVSHMNKTAGLEAWRWLFILEGVPSVLSSVLVWFFLPDYPETAKWLSVEEKELAAARLLLNGSHGGTKNMTWADAKATLTDWRLYAHYIIYFCKAVPFSSLSLFTPSITSGLGYTSVQAQLMSVPPYAAAYIATIIVALSSDRYGTRALHSVVFMIVGAIGFIASALLPATAYTARYGCLIIACTGSFACIPPLLGWLSANLHTTAAAGLAIALNVSFGAPGQIVGVWIYKANEKKKGYPTGHWTNAALLIVASLGVFGLMAFYSRQNVLIRQGKMNKPIWRM
ncbi:MFS transporter [Cadophora sp. MPI-SDFR-AT-0126]|nr:MFS transporter [Leotiomycetes sp. MPI-SDFR-AT-0126]